MSDQPSLFRKAFQAFNKAAPEHTEAWMNLVRDLAKASASDDKAREVAYLSG